MSKKKLVTFFSILFTVIVVFRTTALAEIDPVSVVSNPTPTGVSTLFTVGNTILSILQTIGAGVAIIATLVLAMKYMYSAPEDKATIKKQLIPFIIGGVLVFGATSLVKLAESLSGELI